MKNISILIVVFIYFIEGTVLAQNPIPSEIFVGEKEKSLFYRTQSLSRTLKAFNFEKNGKWGVADRANNIIIPPKYDRIKKFYTQNQKP